MPGPGVCCVSTLGLGAYGLKHSAHQGFHTFKLQCLYTCSLFLVKEWKLWLWCSLGVAVTRQCHTCSPGVALPGHHLIFSFAVLDRDYTPLTLFFGGTYTHLAMKWQEVLWFQETQRAEVQAQTTKLPGHAQNMWQHWGSELMTWS